MRGDPRRRELAAYPFRLDMVPRFGDMDPNRHLNNVAIARFYEEGRVRFHWHVRETHPEAGRFRVLVAHVAIDYLGEGDEERLTGKVYNFRRGITRYPAPGTPVSSSSASITPPGANCGVKRNAT